MAPGREEGKGNKKNLPWVEGNTDGTWNMAADYGINREKAQRVEW